ncbi:MAG: GspE/PulE family protein [Desulforegulaceae bacterium]|nr:GspE/PulE family protein [Desulforegulaceae bacterium]
MEISSNFFSPKKIAEIMVKRKLLSEKSAKFYLENFDLEFKKIRKQTNSFSSAFEKTIAVDILVSFGFFTHDKSGKKINEDMVYESLADFWGYKYLKVDPLKLDIGKVTSSIPKNMAIRHLMLPVEKTGGQLIVATPYPFNMEAFDDISRINTGKVKAVVSSKSDIIRLINEFYGFQKYIDAAENQFVEARVDLGNLEHYVKLKSMDELPANDQHIVNAVNHMISYAFDQRASDIHIEPKREKTIIRLRIDGVLHPVYKLPKKVHNAIISRIKAMSGLDMAEKRRPQDGRIKTSKNNVEVEMRISTLPVAFGEKVVLRLMDPDILFQDLPSLGFDGRELEQIEKFISSPHGIILVCGPTGSGKSTTLYSALKKISKPEINITTIEDPIEMIHEDFNQIAVKPSIDMTFARALRHILRQDPDVIMIGEMRDLETAKNAVQASLTGHLVLSTLHTNDSPSTIVRLLDLGLEPFLVRSTLIGIVSQRLVRKICDECKYSYEEDVANLESEGIFTGHKIKAVLYKGKGCSKCRGTGYYGRTGVYEIMKYSKSLMNLTRSDVSPSEIKKAAISEGMTELYKNAVKKMLDGKTTKEEVLRVVKISSDE